MLCKTIGALINVQISYLYGQRIKSFPRDLGQPHWTRSGRSWLHWQLAIRTGAINYTIAMRESRARWRQLQLQQQLDGCRRTEKEEQGRLSNRSPSSSGSDNYTDCIKYIWGPYMGHRPCYSMSDEGRGRSVLTNSFETSWKICNLCNLLPRKVCSEKNWTHWKLCKLRRDTRKELNPAHIRCCFCCPGCCCCCVHLFGDPSTSQSTIMWRGKRKIN